MITPWLASTCDSGFLMGEFARCVSACYTAPASMLAACTLIGRSNKLRLTLFSRPASHAQLVLLQWNRTSKASQQTFSRAVCISSHDLEFFDSFKKKEAVQQPVAMLRTRTRTRTRNIHAVLSEMHREFDNMARRHIAYVFNICGCKDGVFAELGYQC